jgi:hypothetical protein
LVTHDAKSLQRYRQVVGGAWDILLRNLPDNPELGFEPVKSKDRGKYRETLGILRYRSIEDHRAKLPMVVLALKEAVQRTVIWIDEQGKSGLYANDGAVKPPIRSMLDAGVTVIGVDLLHQGEFVAEVQPNKRQRWLPDEEAFAGWTYCYNLPLFARRVHDILALIAWAKRDGAESNEVDVAGLNGTGSLVAAAIAQAQGAVARAAIDTTGFRFADLKDVYDDDFVPGAAKYDDLPGLLALSAPTRLWLAGEGKKAPSIVGAAFAAAGKAANLTTFSGESRDAAKAVVEWLLGQSNTERPPG